MEQKEIIEIIKTKDNWVSKELIEAINEIYKNKIHIDFCHISGYECLSDGTQTDECESLEDVRNVLYDRGIEFDETIEDPILLVKSIEDEWSNIFDDGGGSGWIEY